MREAEGVSAHSAVGIEGRRAPRRRRALMVAVLALVAAGGATAAVAGPGLTMRAVSSAERPAPSGTRDPEPSPSSTPAAIALALEAGRDRAVTLPASDPAPEPTADPTPRPTADPTPRPTADPTASPTPGGRPPATTPPASPPPCMEPMAASPTPAQPAGDCPPPPCRWTAAGSGAVMTGPCPPPCDTAAAAPSPGSAAPAYIRACPPPPWSGTVMLTESDAGRTITVHPGTRILVRLASGGGVWTEPVTSDGSVVTRVSSSHDAWGDASGDFRAAHSGKADLTATDSPRCAPQCKVMSRLWIVHIVVVA